MLSLPRHEFPPVFYLDDGFCGESDLLLIIKNVLFYRELCCIRVIDAVDYKTGQIA